MKKREDSFLLPEARLIIGNGFDLKCGLHGSYQDYFKHKKESYNWFKDTMLTALINNRSYGEYNINCFPDVLPDNLNIWDLIFYILSTKKAELSNWCDVEAVIRKCLFDDSGKWSLSFSDLPNILVKKAKYGTFNMRYSSSDIFLVEHFILGQINKGIIKDNETLYQYLKEELKKFELDFIEYLQKDINSVQYQANAEDLISKIVDLNEYNLTEIDTFNYTNIDVYGIDIFNINGDFSFPIFGIDSSEIEDSQDERKIFTKQYRKLERLFIGPTKRSTCADECIYIFGHSLNKQDYDYFFTLFDELDILNDFDRQLVFAYSIYDSNKSKEIVKRLEDGIFALFFSYEKSKGIENPRLLYRLMDEKKIKIKIID